MPKRSGMHTLLQSKQSKHANSTSEQPDYVHYTFDFAQQVFLPYHSRQVGPLYYKVPVCVQIFGISNDGILEFISRQITYSMKLKPLDKMVLFPMVQIQ